jgi:hypothetical protein
MPRAGGQGIEWATRTQMTNATGRGVSVEGKHASNEFEPGHNRLSGELSNARVGDLRTLFSLAIQHAIQPHQRLGGACRTLHSTIPNTVAILAKIGVGQWHMLHRYIGHSRHPTRPATFDKGPPSSPQCRRAAMLIGSGCFWPDQSCPGNRLPTQIHNRHRMSIALKDLAVEEGRAPVEEAGIQVTYGR